MAGRRDGGMLGRACGIEGQLVAWRREFHAHPELGFREVRTAGRVAEVLRGLGYRVRTGVGRTGVVAEAGDGTPVVVVRADMDALPLQEANQAAHASCVAGVMHACGHDAHVAIGLGVATLLAGQAFPGTLRLLFQPSEEAGDEEGVSGARRMVEDGAMAGVGAVLALHVRPDHAAGDVAVRGGTVFAGVDSFRAAILGRGGHGAYPHEAVDPVYLAAHAVLALHTIVSRRLHPTDPAVVGVGAIHGGEADNVIPERVEIAGTIRFTSVEVRERIHAEIERALGVVRALGGDVELRIEPGGMPMVNDAGVVEVVRRVAVELLGDEHVVEQRQEMGAEDLGALLELAPGAMFGLGCRITGDERVLHSPRFDLDERCLPVGAAVLAQAALQLLGGAGCRQ